MNRSTKRANNGYADQLSAPVLSEKGVSLHRSEVTGSNGRDEDYQNHRSKVTGVVDAVGTPNNPKFAGLKTQRCQANWAGHGYALLE